MTTFDPVDEIFADAASIFLPPERLSVSDAAERYVKLNNPGAYIGEWQNRKVPYMCEPMDVLASRSFKGCIFAGPAQSAKTQALLLNWIAYNVVVNPMDMILYCPTNAAARDFSSRRLDRLLKHSPDVGTQLLPQRDADNKFDKHFRSGAIVTLSWPSKTEFAGRPVGRVALTDYDRMDDDIDGDGAPFDLAQKRTTTFGSFAMALAESSPSRPILDPKWVRQSAHQAPPTLGILGLYNRGDRRRLYWPCPHCRTYFEGTWDHIEYDARDTIQLSAETARMVCPHCNEKISFDDRQDMLEDSVWLKDGQRIAPNGLITGRARTSSIASFWLNGVAAAFVSWAGLVETYLNAMADYERTGDENSLKKFFNNDIGVPYVPQREDTLRTPEMLMRRAVALGYTPGPDGKPELGEDNRPVEITVPPNVRCLIANVDVQKDSFIVQVHGIMPGKPFDIFVLDRFTIRKSRRTDGSGDAHAVRPSTYLEDWDLLLDLVIKKTYPLGDGTGRRMMIKLTTCDSGGYSTKKEGVTSNAYAFWRRMRQDGYGARFHLVKGDPRPGIPRASITYPDSQRKDQLSGARGEIPVLLLNSNVLKDTVAVRLDATEPGRGMIHFPDWLPDWWYSEVCVEVRTDKGWENIRRYRNEAWDLLYYCVGVCVSPLLRIDLEEWEDTRSWLGPWDRNDLVLKATEKEKFVLVEKTASFDMSQLAKALT